MIKINEKIPGKTIFGNIEMGCSKELYLIVQYNNLVRK